MRQVLRAAAYKCIDKQSSHKQWVRNHLSLNFDRNNFYSIFMKLIETIQITSKITQKIEFIYETIEFTCD